MGKKKQQKNTNGKQRKQTAWSARVANRMTKPLKSLGKTLQLIRDANAPGEWVAFAAAMNQLGAMQTQLIKIDPSWSPKRKGAKTKLTVGSAISIKTDARSLYKHTGGWETYEGAVIVQDADFDPKYWLVRCLDNVQRVVRKKHVVELAGGNIVFKAAPEPATLPTSES